MTTREDSEFNFVGLARSPVHQTPQAGYYSPARHRGQYSKAKDEPIPGFAGSISSVSNSAAGSRRRQALHPVPVNTMDGYSGAAKSPGAASASPLATLSSSISSKKSSSAAALAARRSTPHTVTRTLKMSPANTTAREESMILATPNIGYRQSGSRVYSSHHSERAGHLPFSSSAAADPTVLRTPQNYQSGSPSIATGTSTSTRRRASLGNRVPSDQHHEGDSASASVLAVRHQPFAADVTETYSPSTTPTIGESMLDNSDGEWSDCSAVFSPIAITPAAAKCTTAIDRAVCRAPTDDPGRVPPATSPMPQKECSPPAGTFTSGLGDATPLGSLCSARHVSETPLGNSIVGTRNINTPGAASVLVRMTRHSTMTSDSSGSGDIERSHSRRSPELSTLGVIVGKETPEIVKEGTTGDWSAHADNPATTSGNLVKDKICTEKSGLTEEEQENSNDSVRRGALSPIRLALGCGYGLLLETVTDTLPIKH